MIELNKKLKIIIEILNAGFIINGNFCRKILNNICENEIDIYSTIYQYIYFENISLYEMDDKKLCMEFVKYLKIILKNFENVYVKIKIMNNNKNQRYIIFNYNNMKINIYLNEDKINNNFLCNSLRIQKKNNINCITINNFLEFITKVKCYNKIHYIVINLQNISIMSINDSIKMKTAICLYKYKKYKIIFNQTFFCYKKSICEENNIICNNKSKYISVYTNNMERNTRIS